MDDGGSNMGGMFAELGVELDDELAKMFDDLESVSCLDFVQLLLQQAPVASTEPTPQPVCPPCPSSSAVCARWLHISNIATQKEV